MKAVGHVAQLLQMVLFSPANNWMAGANVATDSIIKMACVIRSRNSAILSTLSMADAPPASLAYHSTMRDAVSNYNAFPTNTSSTVSASRSLYNALGSTWSTSNARFVSDVFFPNSKGICEEVKCPPGEIPHPMSKDCCKVSPLCGTYDDIYGNCLSCTEPDYTVVEGKCLQFVYPIAGCYER